MCHFHFLHGNTPASLLPVSAKSLLLSWNCSFAIRGIPGSLSDKPFFSFFPSPFFPFLFYGNWGLNQWDVFPQKRFVLIHMRGRETPSHCFLLTGKWLQAYGTKKSMREWEKDRENERERERYLSWEEAEVIYAEVTRTPLISGFTCE